MIFDPQEQTSPQSGAQLQRFIDKLIAQYSLPEIYSAIGDYLFRQVCADTAADQLATAMAKMDSPLCWALFYTRLARLSYLNDDVSLLIEVIANGGQADD